MLADDALIFMKCSLGWNQVSTPTFVLGRMFQWPTGESRVFSPSSTLMKEFSYAYRADRASL
jgi:hypothetical protein